MTMGLRAGIIGYIVLIVGYEKENSTEYGSGDGGHSSLNRLNGGFMLSS